LKLLGTPVQSAFPKPLTRGDPFPDPPHIFDDVIIDVKTNESRNFYEGCRQGCDDLSESPPDVESIDRHPGRTPIGATTGG